MEEVCKVSQIIFTDSGNDVIIDVICLGRRFDEYKELVRANNLTDADFARIAELENYLDEVPDYLALDFAEEYSRLKVEYEM